MLDCRRDPQVFGFGEYELDEAQGTLRRNGQPVRITRKPWSLLLHFVKNPERTYSWEELIASVWEGQRRDPATVRSAVRTLRIALGDGEPWQWIGDVPGFGYRFLQEVKLRPVAPVRPRAPGAPSRCEASSFLDREAELARLLTALDGALEGRRQVVLLHGPPGIGKTRTAAELEHCACELGFVAHWGETSCAGGAPFEPWIPILQGLMERPDAWESAAGPVEELLRGSSESAAAASAQQERQRRASMFERVARLLEDAARRAPVLLVLDDMHAADTDSLALLLSLAHSRRLLQAPLVLLIVHRELESGHLLHRVLHEPGAESLPLRGMGHRALARILESALGRALSPLAVERIARATGGNPFFVAEIARMLASRELDPEAELPIPETVRDVVRMRLSECSRGGLEVLRAASVIGFEFRLPVLLRCLHWRSQDCLTALAQASELDLVVELEGAYRFQHGLVREVLYQELHAQVRVALHQAVGEAIEALYAPALAPHLAQLAHHYSESACRALPERAVDFARRAAEQMKSVFAYAEASRLYRRALEALEFVEQPDPRLRCALLIDCGETLCHAHAALADVRSILFQAMDLASSLGELALLARAVERCTDYLHAKRTFVLFPRPDANDPWLARLEQGSTEALERLGPHVDDAFLARMLLRRAMLYAARSNYAKACEVSDRSAELARRAHAETERMEALGFQWSLGILLDRSATERCAVAQEALAWSQTARRTDVQIHALRTQLFLALEVGQRREAQRISVELERLAGDDCVLEGRASFGIVRALFALLDGRLDEAQGSALQTAKLFSLLNHTTEWVTALLGIQIWWLLLLRGGAAPMIAQAEALHARESELRLSRALLARLHAAAGRLDDARRELADLVPLLDDFPRSHPWLFFACVSAEVCALTGAREHAAALLEQLLPYADRVPIAWPVCLGPVARPLGTLAALCGRSCESRDLLDRAVLHARTLGSPVLEVMAELEHARALRSAPRTSAARRDRPELAAALCTGRALGLHGLLDQAFSLGIPVR
jgi:eukaryotic-like serine/threonine-protein kinase